MRIGVVTLTLKPPAQPSLVTTRELTFDPPPIDPPAVRNVPGNATTVDGLRWPRGTSVSGALVDISAEGTRSPAVNFHIDVTTPETIQVPEAPVVASITPAEIPDQQ